MTGAGQQPGAFSDLPPFLGFAQVQFGKEMTTSPLLNFFLTPGNPPPSFFLSGFFFRAFPVAEPLVRFYKLPLAIFFSFLNGRTRLCPENISWCAPSRVGKTAPGTRCKSSVLCGSHPGDLTSLIFFSRPFLFPPLDSKTPLSHFKCIFLRAAGIV